MPSTESTLTKTENFSLVETLATFFELVQMKLLPHVYAQLMQAFSSLAQLGMEEDGVILQEYKEKLVVVKIDHDSNPKLIEEYKVYGLPTLILFKDGKEVQESRREGAITKVKLKEYLDGLLKTVSIA